MSVFLLLLFFFSLTHAAPASNSLVVLVKTSVSAQLHQTTTLPCWLSPEQSAEGLEVRWYPGDKFDAPILLYQGGKLVETQNSSYTGRVTLGLKDANSGGLRAGDVSLELRDVRAEDIGKYTCYVSSEQGYDHASTELNVIKKGTRPELTAQGVDNKMNVSCWSTGWFPQPQLRWSDNKRTLKPGDLQYGKDQSGLVWVHSWLLVSEPSDVTCSVDLSVGEKENAHVRLGKFVQTNPQGSPVAGWVAFALLLLAVGVALGVLYYKKRGKSGKSAQESPEEQALLGKRSLAELKENYYVNVTPDTTPENPYVIIRGRRMREANVSFPDGDQVTCLTAVKGTPGFTSGKHYWEVSMETVNVAIKQSWWVGVTSQTSFPLRKDVLTSKSNGFGFLASSSKTPDILKLNGVSFGIESKPKTLGVFLDYDGRELSFYEVEKERLICSMVVSFTCEVFPFFNPGKNDQSPMEILHQEAPPGDGGNTEASQETKT